MKLKKDISGAIPVIAKAIPTAAFAPSIPIVTFRHNNWRVIVNKREINIKDIDKKEDAVEVLEYLEGLAEKG